MCSLPTNQVVNGIIASYLDIYAVMVLFGRSDVPSYGFECDLSNYVIRSGVKRNCLSDVKPSVIGCMMGMMRIRGICINSGKHCVLEWMDGRFVWVVDEYFKSRTVTKVKVLERVVLGDEKFCRNLRSLVLGCVSGRELNCLRMYGGLRELKINLYSCEQSDVVVSGRRLKKLGVEIGVNCQNVERIVVSDCRLEYLVLSLGKKNGLNCVIIDEPEGIVGIRLEKCCDLIGLKWLCFFVGLRCLSVECWNGIDLSFLSVCLKVRKLKLNVARCGKISGWKYLRNSSLIYFSLCYADISLDLSVFSGLVCESLEYLILKKCSYVGNFGIIGSMRKLKWLELECGDRDFMFVKCSIFEECRELEYLDLNGVCVECDVFGKFMKKLKVIRMNNMLGFGMLEVCGDVNRIEIMGCSQLKKIRCVW